MLRKRDHSHNNKVEKALNYIDMNHQILDSMADWVRVVDRQGIVIYANRSMKDDLGEDIEGTMYYEITNQPQVTDFSEIKKEIDRYGIIKKEITINSNSYSVNSSPVKDEANNIIAFVEVFRNVSRERLLEKELINKNKKMKDDLEFSKLLQQKILPKQQIIKNIKLDFFYKPSETLTSDIFDIYSVDEENIGIYVCDVAGKGVSAVLMTMFIRQTMRLTKCDPKYPSSIIKELHKKFLSLGLEDEYYFTMFFGIFNIKTKKFTYVNAGHNCMPLRYSLKEGIIESIENQGYPIASLFKEISLREKEIQISPGDKILFYTRDLIHKRDYRGMKFGLERLEKTIRKDPQNIFKTIEEELCDYSFEESEDSLALLLLEVLE